MSKKLPHLVSLRKMSSGDVSLGITCHTEMFWYSLLFWQMNWFMTLIPLFFLAMKALLELKNAFYRVTFGPTWRTKLGNMWPLVNAARPAERPTGPGPLSWPPCRSARHSTNAFTSTSWGALELVPKGKITFYAWRMLLLNMLKFVPSQIRKLQLLLELSLNVGSAALGVQLNSLVITGKNFVTN